MTAASGTYLRLGFSGLSPQHFWGRRWAVLIASYIASQLGERKRDNFVRHKPAQTQMGVWGRGPLAHFSGKAVCQELHAFQCLL